MFPNDQRDTTPAQRPEFVKILIFIGLTLAVSFIDSLFFSRIVNRLYLAFSGTLATFLISNLYSFALCCILVFLYRRYVFHSKRPLFSAVWILFGMQFARSILLNAFLSWLISSGTAINLSFYSLIATGSYYGVLALFYLIARNRLYLDVGGAKVLSSRSGTSTDNDPAILGIDLEDINRRKQRQQINRITGRSSMDASARRSGMGLARKLDLDSNNERVIAQSSRDAIRVMEHKSLDIKHEWNCDDHDGRQSSAAPERVIARGNSNAIHVTEHSSLDMKHEWNCDDRGAAQPDSHTSAHVIAPGSHSIHVTEHSKLNIKHEWNCDDRDSALRVNPSSRSSDPVEEEEDYNSLDQLASAASLHNIFHS